MKYNLQQNKVEQDNLEYILNDIICILKSVSGFDVNWDDNILLMGVSSLDAINFINELNSKYITNLRISQLFRLKDIRSIAEYIMKYIKEEQLNI